MPFAIEGDLAGPGCSRPCGGRRPMRRIPATAAGAIPPLPQGGKLHALQPAITRNGSTASTSPQPRRLEVIEQILITSVTHGPPHARGDQGQGIILDDDSLPRLRVTIGIALDSKAGQFTFRSSRPSRRGRAAAVAARRGDGAGHDARRSRIIPMLLKPTTAASADRAAPDGTTEKYAFPEARDSRTSDTSSIFSAKLFVANGAPGS